jgi:hypothetical protein
LPSPSTSGAPPQADTQAPIGEDLRQGGIVESPNERTSGGSSGERGATGKTLAECMGAWDGETHMSKDEWRNTCKRTLKEPHI